MKYLTAMCVLMFSCGVEANLEKVDPEPEGVYSRHYKWLCRDVVYFARTPILCFVSPKCVRDEAVGTLEPQGCDALRKAEQ